MKKLLLTSGILLTILSSAISYFIVENNANEISKSQAQIRDLENKINVIWDDNQIQQAAIKNLILLVATQADDEILQDSLVRDAFNLKDIQSIDGLVAQTSKNHYAVIERVDDYYSQIIDLRDRIDYVAQQNNQFKTAALISGLLGLVLILISNGRFKKSRMF